MAYQALLDNGTASSDIVLAGESAGGGLAIATMVNARDRGVPLPAAALVMSPYADLTLAGASMETRREVDPLLSREALEARIPDYTAGHDAADDVEFTLDITPGVPHVFQAYYAILDEAGAALDRAGQELSAHLGG